MNDINFEITKITDDERNDKAPSIDGNTIVWIKDVGDWDELYYTTPNFDDPRSLYTGQLSTRNFHTSIDDNKIV